MPSKRRLSQKKRVSRRREKKLSKKGGRRRRRTQRLNKKGSGPGTQELIKIVDNLSNRDIPTFILNITVQTDEDIKTRYSGQFRQVVIEPLAKAKKISEADKVELRNIQIMDKESLWNAIEECVAILESTYNKVETDKETPSMMSMFKSSEHKDLHILRESLDKLQKVINEARPLIETSLGEAQSKQELEEEKRVRAQFAIDNPSKKSPKPMREEAYYNREYSYEPNGEIRFYDIERFKENNSQGSTDRESD